MRRRLAEKMLAAAERFPDNNGSFSRHVTFLPSYRPNVGYVLLQLRAPEAYRAEPDYREKRQALLEIACGAARNKFSHLTKVIGIGIDAPKFAGGNNAGISSSCRRTSTGISSARPTFASITAR